MPVEPIIPIKCLDCFSWSFVAPGRAESERLSGRLDHILPARDTCKEYQALVAEGVAVVDKWFFDGREIVGVSAPDWPGAESDVTAWIDLGPANMPVTLTLGP